MQVTHERHSLGHGVEDTAVDSDRGNRVNGMLQVEDRRFQKRDDVPCLSDE